jgi:hypothetical protein
MREPVTQVSMPVSLPVSVGGVFFRGGISRHHHNKERRREAQEKVPPRASEAAPRFLSGLRASAPSQVERSSWAAEQVCRSLGCQRANVERERELRAVASGDRGRRDGVGDYRPAFAASAGAEASETRCVATGLGVSYCAGRPGEVS